MLNLLFGRALWRWLEGLADDQPAKAPEGPPPPPVTVEVSPLADVIAQTDRVQSGEWVTPKVERAAMGCLFEVYLAGHDREGLVGAGNEALEEVERLDRQLSHYRADSDISRLNAHAADQWVRLEPRLYELLKRSAELSAETDGAFDIASLPLLRAWGFHTGEHRVPSDEELAALLPSIGSANVEFDDEDRLVRFLAPGVEIGLGAVGKGYAVDEAVETLRFYHVDHAVVHGGQSTIYALGAAPEEDAWPFTLHDPRDRETPIAEVRIRDEALSTSAATEQAFEAGGQRFGHIVDPRTGRPASACLSVWVIAPSAELSDALSTAFFVGGPDLAERYTRAHPGVRALLVLDAGAGEIDVRRYGL